MRKKMFIILWMLLMLIGFGSLWEDVGAPSCAINLEIKSETGTVPPTAISYELWLNDGYYIYNEGTDNYDQNYVSSSSFVEYETYDIAGDEKFPNTPVNKKNKWEDI